MMKNRAGYIVFFYSLLLIGNTFLKGNTISVSPQDSYPTSYISVAGPVLLAVEPSAQSVSNSLRLFPQVFPGNNIDEDSNVIASFGNTIAKNISAALYISQAVISCSHIRYLLFPFHSFL
ncbi:MAG: hypothetical protein WD604_06065 [Balneolaceae bacterium]